MHMLDFGCRRRQLRRTLGRQGAFAGRRDSEAQEGKRFSSTERRGDSCGSSSKSDRAWRYTDCTKNW
jgi:hypothetical protein